MIVFAPALHGMEDEVSAPIYLMIDDFEQISHPINTQPQVFILVTHSLYWPVVQIRPEGVQNVLPADMVLECGLVKLDDNFVHVSSILPPSFPVNIPRRLLGEQKWRQAGLGRAFYSKVWFNTSPLMLRKQLLCRD
jgi:hypothetical protein